MFVQYLNHAIIQNNETAHTVLIFKTVYLQNSVSSLKLILPTSFCKTSNIQPTSSIFQDNQSRASEHSEASTTAYSSQEYSSSSNKSRPAPPKKPLRLSLHRAASLQSVESAPPTTSSSNHHHHQSYHHHHLQDTYTPSKKPTKRNYRGDPPLNESQLLEAPQPPPRTPSRAESCQSALRWPSPKPRPHLTQLSMEKWC